MGQVVSSILINGKSLSVPKEFFDVGVKASFGENIQGNLTTEDFTFILDAYDEIIRWIQTGRTGGVGIFEGIPFSISTSNGVETIATFNGILDLQAGANIQEQLRQVQCSLRQDNSLNQLDELLEPLDYGYLKSIGVITSSDYVDVDYVVNPIDNSLETITTFITVYLLSKQLADSVRSIADTAGVIAGIAVSGATGPIGAAVYAVAKAIIEVAYAATLLILIVDFGKDLLAILVQPVRTHKAILLRTLISKACEHIGYTLETTVADLANVVYLPSNQSVDDFGLKGVLKRAGTITEGIPNSTDAGYTCSELFQLARDLFNGRFAIQGNTVQFHSENSSYWISQSGWEKPNISRDFASSSFRYNTDEIKSSIALSFRTDLIDEYTIKNYTGNAYQVLTTAEVTSKPKNSTLKNVDLVNFPVCLGSRKEDLNSFEKALLPLANLFDSLAGVFGRRPNLARKVKNKVGVLEVSANNHSVPKLLWLQSGRLPSNHRDLFSARTLWEKYHSEKSFVQNSGARQRKSIEGEDVPFSLSDFVQLLNNSYFRDENGKVGKITELEWNLSRNFATISYWIQERYTTNLKETFIEPS